MPTDKENFAVDLGVRSFALSEIQYFHLGVGGLRSVGSLLSWQGKLNQKAVSVPVAMQWASQNLAKLSH
eukprot:3954967-Amphidinium_carterae.1